MPSREDLKMTEKLRKGGELLGIDVVDSVIIGSGDYYSFYQHGAFREGEDDNE